MTYANDNANVRNGRQTNNDVNNQRGAANAVITKPITSVQY